MLTFQLFSVSAFDWAAFCFLLSQFLLFPCEAMLYLLFQLGEEAAGGSASTTGRYALEANRVVEVVPLLSLTRIPQSPKGVAGMFVYRGRAVPAVDLCELTGGSAARERLSTRIIIIDYSTEQGARSMEHGASPSSPRGIPCRSHSSPRGIPVPVGLDSVPSIPRGEADKPIPRGEPPTSTNSVRNTDNVSDSCSSTEKLKR